MAGKKILVAFEFTEYDERALHYVMRNFADQKWVNVTLFHVYTPLPDIDTSSNPGLSHLRSTMDSLRTELGEKEAEFKKIKEDLLDNGFRDDQVDYVFKARTKDIGGEIVDMVLKESYDTIVLSYKPRKFIRTFTRKVHDKLLNSLEDTTITIIT